MSPRKSSDERAFQTTHFRRPTLSLEDRSPAVKSNEVGPDTLQALERVIWPEPLGHLLPPDEWAPEGSGEEPPEQTRVASQDERVTQAPHQSKTPTLVDNLQAGALVDGRYQVLDQLGSGGMARILKVRHVDLGRDFALKIIHPGKVENSRFQRSLLREARIISQLEHPNIVQVTDFGADPNLGVFVVMEYLKGQTLYDRLVAEDRLRLPIALNIVLQVAEALRYMHTENLVHRDIKPENIFLCRAPEGHRQHPRVRLIDFGLSGPDAKATFKASSGVVGTPAYMAPEQIRGMAPRASMDIYALGILLYELLTGRPPFVGKLDEIIIAHVLEVPPNPSKYLAEPLDETVEALILKALAKAPQERHQSMQEFVYELRTTLDMLGIRRNRRRRHSRGGGAGQEPSPTELVFTATESPLFLLEGSGKVVAANPAMAAFMRVPARSLVSTSLLESRLPEFYPELAADLRTCVVQRQGVRRLVRIPRDPEPAAQVMFWLAPVARGGDRDPWVSGFVVPFLCDQQG